MSLKMHKYKHKTAFCCEL